MGDKSGELILCTKNVEQMKLYVEQMINNQTDEIIKHIDKMNSRTDEFIVLNNKIKELENNNKILEQSLNESKDYLNEYDKRCIMLEEKCRSKDNKLILSNEKIENLENELEIKNKTVLELQEKKIDIVKEYNQRISDLNKSLMNYEVRFKEIMEAFCVYQELSNEIKLRIKNIFGYNDIRYFIAATTEWNNVEGLWDFTKRRVIENKNEEAKRLVYLFRFLFEQYSKGVSNRLYELITPSIGDKYDSDKHTILGKKTDGTVSDVLIDGIYNFQDNKIIFKAVIEVQ